jgi:hypothetical protein
MTYKKQMGLAIASLAVCAMPVVLPLIPKFGAWAEAERVKAETQLKAQNLQTREELERLRIEERGKTSATLLKTGVLPTNRTVRVVNYFDSPKQRPRLDTTIYQDDEVVDVFDATGRCIGRIAERRFQWKYDKESGICSGVQNVEPIQRSRKE